MANYFTNQYKDKKEYQDANGVFQPNLLPEDVKTQIRDLTAGIGAVIGGTVGDSTYNAQLAGVIGQNAVENNHTAFMANPSEFDEIKNDNTGTIPKETLKAIKNNTSYKINQNGDFLVCVKVAGFSCAPRAGERYATSKEIAQKGGESLLTMAAGYGAGKVAEPIVLSIGKSGVWSKISSIFSSSGKISINPKTGLKEISPSSTPLDSHKKLNQLDQGKFKPAEAATGGQLESALGQMQKYSGSTTSKNPDWVITSGPNKGKTVDAMYTTDKLSQKEIEGLNKFYEKNMTVAKKTGEFPPEIANIQKHLNKADFVPIDFRVLNKKNQSIFLNYVKTLPKSQQSKFIIVR
ncbi:MAG: VENN motif pre-toxin domain-containing protein [Acinetobacter sp.]